MNTHRLEAKSHSGDWEFSAKATEEGGVWFHIFAGPMAGGVRLTPGQARLLAANLLAAESDAQRQIEKLREAAMGLA